MSTRYMKKVYGGDVIAEKDHNSASDTEISVTNGTKSKSFNVFDVVCDDRYAVIMGAIPASIRLQCSSSVYDVIKNISLD